MAGIFPYSQDGGLPPNPGQPNNPAQAFDPTIPPQDTSALYYGNGCDVRLRPAVVNSLISEIAATADRAGSPYKAASLQNLEFAVRYLIQRGLPRGALLVATNPFNFTVTLDPVPAAYTDLMTLTLVPALAPGDTQNQAYVRVNVNGLGSVPLLRNDGGELHAADLLQGKPLVATYYQGAFYLIGLAASQVPLVKIGGIDVWVRTDGNDATADGTTNTPDKAFRTIQAAWNSVGARYAATPLFSINIKLGIPGTYEGAAIGPFGGAIVVMGDINNRWNYRISTFDMGQGLYGALDVNGVTQFAMYGITLLVDSPTNRIASLFVGQTLVGLYNVGFDVLYDNTQAALVSLMTSSSTQQGAYDVTFRGNGHTIGGAIEVNGSQWGGSGDLNGCTLTTTDLNITIAYAISTKLSTIEFLQTTMQTTNVTGKQYAVDTNSLLIKHGLTVPGTIAGTVDTATGGVVVA